MASVNLVPTIYEVTSGSSWVLTGNPGSGGSAAISSGNGSTGDKFVYLKNLSSGIPLDAEITGVRVQVNVTPTTGGSFGASDNLKVNLGFFDTFDRVMKDGTEKTSSLNGLSGTTTRTFGGSTDNWGKAFWSRYQFVYGADGFGISIRRTGPTDITIASVVITVYYNLRAYLAGSRAPVPKDSLSGKIEQIFSLKQNGTSDSSIIKSSDVNALGDALYNIEKIILNPTSTSNIVQVYGGQPGDSLLMSTLYVSGTVSNFEGDLVYDECNDGSNTKINISAITDVYRSLPTIPINTSVNYDIIGGHGWVSLGATKVPLAISVGGFALKNVNGTKYHRLTFKGAAADNVGLANILGLSGYPGVFVPHDGPVTELNSFAEFVVKLDNTDGSPAIPGMSPTYNNGATAITGPQAFKIHVDTTTVTNGVKLNKRYVKCSTIDEVVSNGVCNGIKLVSNTSTYDYVEFNVYTGGLGNYSGTGYNLYDFTRTGVFVYGAGDGASLNGYGVMFSRGADNSYTQTAWLVKFSSWDSSVAVSLPNYSSPSGYTSFPWPGGNTQINQISGASSYTITSNLNSPDNPKRYRLSVSDDGTDATITFKELSFNTGQWTTVLTGIDTSSAYTTAGKAGFFLVKPTIPVPTTQLVRTELGLESIVFGFESNPTTSVLNFEARLIGVGKLK